jgi:hypothetical protein
MCRVIELRLTRPSLAAPLTDAAADPGSNKNRTQIEWRPDLFKPVRSDVCIVAVHQPVEGIRA